MREDLSKARREYQMASRQLLWHLNRHGRVPIGLVRRLGKARGRFVAAIAGRRDGGGR